jgi:hypothetical protein
MQRVLDVQRVMLAVPCSFYCRYYQMAHAGALRLGESILSHSVLQAERCGSKLSADAGTQAQGSYIMAA